MHTLLARYPHYFKNGRYIVSFCVSLVAFTASVYANYLATLYASARASNSVTDIILSNTPVFDVDGFFVYGAMALIVFILAVCLSHPRHFPFTLFALASLIFIRAAFITLTHLGPYPDHVPISVTSSIGIFFSKLFFGDDLFFSNHTAIPFMMALVYWRHMILRYIFLAWSFLFAITVLMGHIHYSIDVASAYFIAYAIYHLVLKLFPKEYEMFHSGIGSA